MSANPFRSDWLDGAAGDRLRPQGTQSYVSGATDEPLRFITISQQLDKTVSRHGSRDAAMFDATGRAAVVVRPASARPTNSPPACSRSGCGAATASASGHPIAPSGW